MHGKHVWRAQNVSDRQAVGPQCCGRYHGQYTKRADAQTLTQPLRCRRCGASLFLQVSNHYRRPDKVYEGSRHDPLQSRERQLLAREELLTVRERPPLLLQRRPSTGRRLCSRNLRRTEID